MALSPHYCFTEDDMRIVCICTTGRNHTEDEMDLNADDTVESES